MSIETCEQELRELGEICERVQRETDARLVLVLDSRGRSLARAGAGSEAAEAFLRNVVESGDGSSIVPAVVGVWQMWPDDDGDDGEHVELRFIARRMALLIAYEGRERRARVEAWTKTAADEIQGLLEVVFERVRAPVDADGRILTESLH